MLDFAITGFQMFYYVRTNFCLAFYFFESMETNGDCPLLFFTLDEYFMLKYLESVHRSWHIFISL